MLLNRKYLESQLKISLRVQKFTSSCKSRATVVRGLEQASFQMREAAELNSRMYQVHGRQSAPDRLKIAKAAASVAKITLN